MDYIAWDILRYICRKLGLFTRYLFFLAIGQKETLKYLDRRQRDPVDFTQRGINTFIGIIEIVIIIALLTKI